MEQRILRITLCAFALLAMCSAAFNYPTYSLDNMPSTKFTCRDKILGGYYADAETQCQMFHVCVKVAGVGVQDFRFLCPNATAFDQEAQTCADWGDVDCEATTLYYGSNNFDLYRVGSGFESKRAPFPDEEEATFHLQRAETSDARRSKQVVINQSAKPQQQPQYQSPATYRTTNSHFSNYNNVQTFDKTTSRYVPEKIHHSSTSARPSTPTPPRPTTTTTTPPPPTTTTSTSTTTFAPQFVAHQQTNSQQNLSPVQNYNPYATYNNQAQSTRLNPYSPTPTTTVQPRPQQQQQQQQHSRQTPNYYQQPSSTSTPIVQYSLSDDIFRGSYSSNFFNNRNNGKEDYESDVLEKKPVTTKATQKPAVRGRLISRGRVTYNSSQRGPQSNFNIIGGVQKPANAYQSSTIGVTTTTTSTPQPVAVTRNYNNIRTNSQRLQTANVTPVTYRPSTISSSSFRVPVARITASPSTPAPLNPEEQFYDVPRKVPGKSATPSTTSKPFESSTPGLSQPFQSRFNPNANYDLTAVQQSKFTYNPYGEPRVSPSLDSVTSSSFFPTSPSTTSNPLPTTTSKPAPVTSKAPFFPTPAPQLQQSSPRGFEVIPITLQPQAKTYQAQEQRPQPFSRRIDTKHNTPTTAKKFSTLVPRELYDPTTFKPSTYKKPVDNLAAIKAAQFDKQRESSKYTPTNFVTTTTTTTTQKPAPITYSPIQYNTFQSTQSPQSYNAQSQNQFQSNSKPFNAPSTPFQSAPAAVQNSFPTTNQRQQYYSTAAPAFNYNGFVSSTIAPRKVDDIDENDGQYHPELYEKDFARYKIKNKKTVTNKIQPTANNFQSSTGTAQVSHNNNGGGGGGLRAPFQNPIAVSGSGEEEFLKTAYSQNIVASGNQLLYDQLKTNFKQQQQQQQSQPQPPATVVQQQPTVASPRPFSKTAPTIPPNATTTKRPVKAKKEKDVSYDYQYYDLGADSSPRDYEFDLLEDFGKLKKTKPAKKQ